jgi:hypothetical protein
MTRRLVRVGKRHGAAGTDQLITVTYETEADGTVREHITLETPTPVTDTQRLRLLKTWEIGREWKS